MADNGHADHFRNTINECQFHPIDQWGLKKGKDNRNPAKRYAYAESTPYVGVRFETVFKEGAHSILPRLGLCNGSDLYVDTSQRDGAVINAARELLLWIAVTHDDNETYMEIFAPDSLREVIRQQMERTICELLNDSDHITETCANDFNTVYSAHEATIQQAQYKASDWVEWYCGLTETKQAEHSVDYAHKSQMVNYLSPHDRA